MHASLHMQVMAVVPPMLHRFAHPHCIPTAWSCSSLQQSPQACRMRMLSCMDVAHTGRPAPRISLCAGIDPVSLTWHRRHRHLGSITRQCQGTREGLDPSSHRQQSVSFFCVFAGWIGMCPLKHVDCAVSFPAQHCWKDSTIRCRGVQVHVMSPTCYKNMLSVLGDIAQGPPALGGSPHTQNFVCSLACNMQGPLRQHG